LPELYDRHIGTWGDGAFDNDTAADWSLEFEDADLDSGLVLIERALRAASDLADSGYLGADEGMLAVAAAELVGSIIGPPRRNPYNEEAVDWISRVHASVTVPLIDLARQALVRVTGERSELAMLWDEAGDAGWCSVIEDLRGRLTIKKDGSASGRL
jgi:hypothetical protein